MVWGRTHASEPSLVTHHACTRPHAAAPRTGVSTLQFRRANVLNDYAGLLLEAYLRASGRPSVHVSVVDSPFLRQQWALL